MEPLWKWQRTGPWCLGPAQCSLWELSMSAPPYMCRGGNKHTWAGNAQQQLQLVHLTQPAYDFCVAICSPASSDWLNLAIAGQSLLTQKSVNDTLLLLIRIGWQCLDCSIAGSELPSSPSYALPPLVSAIGWANSQLGTCRAAHMARQLWERCSVPSWQPSRTGDGAEWDMHERQLLCVNLPLGGVARALEPSALAVLCSTTRFTNLNQGQAEAAFGNSESSALWSAICKE